MQLAEVVEKAVLKSTPRLCVGMGATGARDLPGTQQFTVGGVVGQYPGELYQAPLGHAEEGTQAPGPLGAVQLICGDELVARAETEADFTLCRSILSTD